MKKVLIVIMAVALLAAMCVTLAACSNIPDSASEAKKKMQDAGYTVQVFEKSDFGNVAGAKWGIVATRVKGESVDTVSVICFEKKSQAEDYYSKVEKSSSITYEQKDCYCIAGTKQGIKDLKD